MTPSWSSSCRADMPLECVAIKCAAQNHIVSGNFDRCIAVPAVSEVCRPQSRHSNKRGRLLQGHSACPAARGTNKPVWPASCKKKPSAARLVRKFFLELRQRASAPHRSALQIGAASKRARLHTLHIAEYSGT